MSIGGPGPPWRRPWRNTRGFFRHSPTFASARLAILGRLYDSMIERSFLQPPRHECTYCVVFLFLLLCSFFSFLQQKIKL